MSLYNPAMTYRAAVDYLFSATPVYQQVGTDAYKPGLGNIEALDAHYGHPHRAYATIHVGGTNGKGSTSHSLAAALAQAGYRVGLFTSPHLVDFRERIRINGTVISESYVTQFVMQAQSVVERIRPSFFELTTMLALCYFRDQGVDIAIIEVGLGGRLDSTNIISPILSIITNISLDHTALLGSSLPEIAREKAGIIKPHTPVVIGRAEEQVRAVFDTAATERMAPIRYASESGTVTSHALVDGRHHLETPRWGHIILELQGCAQLENARTVLTALDTLTDRFTLPAEAIRQALMNVCRLTGLRGRWETLTLPSGARVVCDTAHNEDGLRVVASQLRELHAHGTGLHIVLGMSADKDVRPALAQLPSGAGYHYYFTRARSARALPETELAARASDVGLSGSCYPEVGAALAAALANAAPGAQIFVGGSNFVVADLIEYIDHQ